MRTCVIFNPAARGDKARRFRSFLNTLDCHISLCATTRPGAARELARDAVNNGFETIVAAGGDGTLNEVLNGMADAPDGCNKARLGVLPLGTVNVFARELNLPRNLMQAWQVIQAGREMRIDLPVASFSATSQRRYFAQLAGAGLDARAIELVHWPLKKRIGALAYVLAGMHALCGPPGKINVQTPDHSLNAELVLIGNGRLYGGNFTVFPQADLNDGLLEICAFPKVNWLTLARYAPRLIAAGKIPSSAALCFKAQQVTLTHAGTPVPVEVDGELAGKTPATFSIERQRLRVVLP